MNDRRALIIGSWEAKGKTQPSKQKVLSLTKQWGKLFAEEMNGFRSLLNRRRAPDILYNPTRAYLTHHFENARQITSDTELLLYFLGHSTCSGTDDLQLVLGLSDDGEDRGCSLRLLLSTVRDVKPALSKLVLALDTCHAGRSEGIIQAAGFEYFAMFSAGSRYAYDAVFTEGLIRALQTPLRKSDQRIDRQAGGVTYRKVFEDARRFVLSRSRAESTQTPACSGQYVGEILVKAPVVTPRGYNEFASSRTIYGRLFSLLRRVARADGIEFDDLCEQIAADNTFLIRSNGTRSPQYVSSERLAEYVDFLRRVGWIVEPEGRLEVTEEGRRSCNPAVWNERLLAAIQDRILPENFTFDELDSVVSEVLNDRIPPTPMKIAGRMGMKGIKFALDSPARVALQVLPATGRFMRGSADAIFPSELGGDA